MKDHESLPLIPIKNGKGIYLYDFDNNMYIDAISSWWVNTFGHSNEYINSAIKEQLNTLEHVILAGFTHKSAIDLAKKLVDITPIGLNKVFFADNGSSAIEVALKMSYHYFKNIGQEKDTFLSLSNSYHGETLGALSVGDVTLYKDTYKPLLIKNMQTPVPKDTTIEAANSALEKLEEILKENHKKIAALIIEPLIQGAGAMHMYHPAYISGARALTKKYNIHLIADEIMTGFGRTGTMFACEQADVSPDFMTLSKGLTGGYLPLSVAMVTDEIYSKFYCDYNDHKAFLHSHSYTGNALACAAALATLEIFENDNVIEKNKETSKYILDSLEKFKSLNNVENIRQTGMVAAFDIKGYKSEDRIGLQVYKFGLQHGVLLRPLGNTIYFMPPYIITKEEINKMLNVAYEAIKSLK
jgi:adenosylmethionine-8-amino-7-oxononanoate aminotransferase